MRISTLSNDLKKSQAVLGFFVEQRVTGGVVMDDAEPTAIAMNTMTLTIERTPRTVQSGGRQLQVEELSIRLPFARKPTNLGDLDSGEWHKVYITDTLALSTAEFDAFASNLMQSRDWLRGKGGGTGDAYFCVEVTAPDRPVLYVNPEGGDYARYAARMG